MIRVNEKGLLRPYDTCTAVCMVDTSAVFLRENGVNRRPKTLPATSAAGREFVPHSIPKRLIGYTTRGVRRSKRGRKEERESRRGFLPLRGRWQPDAINAGIFWIAHYLPRSTPKTSSGDAGGATLK